MVDIKEYKQDGTLIREITKDGILVGREEIPIPVEQTEPVTAQLTLEEMQLQTLLNTEYLVIMSEIGM